MPDSRLFPATIMPDSDWWHALWPDPRGVLMDLGVQPNMQVVDLCCGDGHFTKPLCRLVFPGKTWALDLDVELLEQAKRACQGNSNFQAVMGDARKLPELLDEPVDFVFIANTFHGVPDKAALSQAVFDSLKPDGRFAVVNWYRRPREETQVLDQPRGPDTELRMEPVDVQRIVEPVGFRLEKVVDVGPYHYGAVFIKQSSRA